MPRVLFDDFLFVLVVLVIVVNLSKVFVYAAYFFAGVLVLVLVLVGLTKLAAAAALFGVAFLADDEDLFAAEAGAAAFAFGVGFFAERVEAALFDPPFFVFVDDTNGLIN